MKYFCLVLSFCMIVIAACFLSPQKSTLNDKVIRIHIRAHSDDDVDQSVKFAVKDSIVAFLTPLLKDLESIDVAKSVVNNNINELIGVANAALAIKNYEYECTADIRTEQFPTRVYDGVTFDSGEYTALIVDIGSGKGNNWWCVMYPPLCFLNAEGDGKIKYRSYLMELLGY